MKYDVALSFAGQDRRYVTQVAEQLKLRGIRVFYDEYEQADLWGKNLYDHLSKVYRQSAKYCIVFISKFYAERLWTTLERQSAQARAFNDNQEYILPVRFDDTQIPGLPETIGYIDLRTTTPIELAELAAIKLGNWSRINSEFSNDDGISAFGSDPRDCTWSLSYASEFQGLLVNTANPNIDHRSEERRVGKECRSRWSPYH